MAMIHLLGQTSIKKLFEEYLPELDMKNIKHSELCEVCQKCLEHFRNLILADETADKKEKAGLQPTEKFGFTEDSETDSIKNADQEDKTGPRFVEHFGSTEFENNNLETHIEHEDFSQNEKYVSKSVDIVYSENIVSAVKNESVEFQMPNVKVEEETYLDLNEIVSQLKNDEIEIKYDLSDEERDEVLAETTISWAALQIDEKDNEVETNTVVENSWRKRRRDSHLCYYCKKEVTNFARHILRHHSSEKDVITILSKPVNSKERKEFLSLLRKKGNYFKSIGDHCKSTSLRKKMSLCIYCLGFYSRKCLRNHRKICAQKLGGGTPDQVEDNQELTENVFPRMRPDGISLEAKRDSLICAFGARILKIHRNFKYIHVISRRMRELARVLLGIKKMELSVQNLFQALKPRYFSLFVEATKNIAQYDIQNRTCRSPTAIVNINTSLRQCCNIALNDVKKSKEYLAGIDPSEAEANLKDMIELLVANWKCQFPYYTGNTSFQNQNNVTILSLASDVKLLKNHLTTTATSAVVKLSTNNKDPDAYNVLLETIFCNLMVFNQMTPRELQGVPYALFDPEIEQNCKKLSRQVSTAQDILMKTSLYIIHEQEGGQQVPILFNRDLQEHIKILLQVRPNFLSPVNPFLFQKPSVTNTSRWVHGVLNDFVKNCGAKNPDALTSAHLTKYVAVLLQISGLPECDIKKLIGHMGLVRSTSKHFNSDDIYEIARISKIFLLMDQGIDTKFKGKSLDQIGIDLEDTLLKSKEIIEDPENIGHSNGNVTIKTKPSKMPSGVKNSAKSKKSKRTLVPWTFEQKDVVAKFFKYHVDNKKPPKRRECDMLIAQHPILLHNKSWLKIKVFIQNLYTKKTSFSGPSDIDC